METDEDVDAKEMLSDETMIRRNYRYLKDEIDPKYIVDDLIENNIITDNEKEEICNPYKARHKRMDILLKILLRKSSFEHGSFLLIMKNLYKHVAEILEKTTDFTKRDEMQDLGKWIDRIKHSKKYLSKTISPTSTVDFLLQELPENEFSLDMHDKILHENRTVCEQANLALDFIIETRISSILSCFLESLPHAQHNRSGEEIIALLMKAGIWFFYLITVVS
ncbi:uncharacterized protein LOC134232951 [Saccostrea cucullata]|uniref:uncharacterized protein LOC134232524 n=1 Tax=Saccostrea cuccullata TaxID=36930 RepID=UPI002ED345DC